jgi:molybdenum cofactor synthesis domain-containing protein
MSANITIRAIAITVSDRCARGEQKDVSGAVLAALLKANGAEIIDKLIVSDDLEPLIATLRECALREGVNLVITTGGTGFAPRDNTPEATRAVITREAPGLAEAMRAESLKNMPLAMLSRGVCGILGATLIINLPGSPKAVRECFNVIKPALQHAVNLLGGITTH